MQLVLPLFQQMSVYLLIVYVFSKTPLFRPLASLSSWPIHKLMVYAIFSGFCIMGTYFGQQNLGAIANTRAIGAILGGLLGGPFVGTAVGFTGGMHRFSMGGFTDLACAISTTWEGFLGGLVHAFWQRCGQTERIFNPWQVFFLGLFAEGCQMAIILIVAHPSDQAKELVEQIALPMMLANSIGAALFMSFIRDAKFRAEELAATVSDRALRIARRCVGVLEQGFNARSAATIAEIVKDETGVAAVAITDREQILAFTGMGADHHKVGRPISSRITLDAIRFNRVVFADGLSTPYQCSITTDCELGSSLVVPLKGEKEVVGTIKLYEPKRKLFRNLNRSLGVGIAGVLSNQLLHDQLQANRALLAEAELKALEAKVNPHFLFNSLNTVAAVLRRDAKKARELIVHLAGFLRGNLGRHSVTVTLAEEFAHIDHYLAIEKVRFGERLTYIETLGPGLEGEKVPALAIQTLVENAIKHGISQAEEGGQVSLEARLDGNEVHIVIDDSAARLPVKSDGLGLKLVRERFAALGVSCTLQLHHEPGLYTRAELRWPRGVLS
ncbi:MAG: sensor histidine kinase [Pseudomonadota bacterium]|uniref:histidine kinase n=1 Tax=Gallaecimonas pentaromativorans TaxID=584787 RepID=A0A3N1P9Z0_9GAMM|nr:sensor histidine kinase [Gallaecimonas pentaromativorans]MED5523918.1 sensor histidine kinase [Pseudomonadota bacterium]ROQ24849.1 signal transduction histidine kinase LytS [Gallaecimonas pentaromativorans]